MVNESFKDFVLDQLRVLSDLRARSMFGGHGLYRGTVFFGILYDGRLYFKTNAATRGDYVARGMEPFSPVQHGRKMTMDYHEVPPEILENSEALIAWANRSIQIAAKRPAKSASKRR
jgi:DNA transformation protein and related proteins